MKNTEIDPLMEKEFLERISQTGELFWSDIKELKARYTISNELTAALIIKHGLDFELEPRFAIRIKQVQSYQQ